MRLSKHFLNDFIDLTDIDYHDLANHMVFTGNEYDSIEKMSDATGLVIGEVVECVAHPESDHLHICQVNLGTEVKQILCGAPNVAAKQKVIVATVGAKLPGGIVIKKAKLAGMDSEGMICSLSELGIDSKYQSEEDKMGIHVLNADAPIGEDALIYLGFDDEVIDFDLTADRGDLMSVLGMAYEVGAIYDRQVCLPKTDFSTNEDTMEGYQLDVITPNCSIYLGKVVKGVTITESPNWLKNRLIASGIRPINNVVDISNYVMLEFGQPLHFFDADQLGKQVIVRQAHPQEKLVTLDGVERQLLESDLVIANEQGPVALAGVMGGLTTEVEATTKNIFIEAAIFDSFSIRRTSNRILRSEASNRYEKGIDPARTEMALFRACYLLEKYASGSPVQDIACYDTTSKEAKEIVVDLKKINQVLGMNLTVEAVKSTLKRLAFEVEVKEEQFRVFVPTRRLDVNIKEDLIAEIGKIYGYHHVIGSLPVTSMKQGSYSAHAKLVKEVRKRLQALGLQQVITYSLIHEDNVGAFVTVEKEPIILANPLSEDHRVLRQSLVSSLLEVYNYNVARGEEQVQIFECGSAYYKEQETYTEESCVAGLLHGTYLETSWGHDQKNIDFYVVKGIIENLLCYLGYQNRYQFVTENLPQELHPGRSVVVLLDRQPIGFFGQLHPQLEKKDVYVFELSLQKLLEKTVRQVKYKEVSKYPSVHKDLAFLVKKETKANEIEEILKKVGGRLLTAIRVFDVYEGEQLNEKEKSIAFALTFQDQNRTLTDEEVTTIFNKMIETVSTKLDAVLRDK